MDTLTRYRNAIKQVIQEHAQHKSALEDICTEVVFDETNDHYALVKAGWHGMRRVEGQVIHIDIIDDKIWIQFDGTQDGVAHELEALGVSKQEIVLGFHSPAKRPSPSQTSPFHFPRGRGCGNGKPTRPAYGNSQSHQTIRQERCLPCH